MPCACIFCVNEMWFFIGKSPYGSNLPPCFHCLQSIDDQIDNHLIQLCRIGRDLWQVGEKVNGEVRFLIGAPRFKKMEPLFNQLIQIHFCLSWRQFSSKYQKLLDDFPCIEAVKIFSMSNSACWGSPGIFLQVGQIPGYSQEARSVHGLHQQRVVRSWPIGQHA